VLNSALLHDDVWGNKCIGPRILNLRTKIKSVVSFTLQPFYRRGKGLQYLLDERSGGLQSWFGNNVKDKKVPPLPGNEFRSSSPCPYVKSMQRPVYE